MKKIIAFVLLIAMMCTLTGCIRYRAEFRMNEDGSSVVRYLIAEPVLPGSDPEEVGETLSAVFDDETREAYRRMGIEIKDYEEDGYVGCILEYVPQVVRTEVSVGGVEVDTVYFSPYYQVSGDRVIYENQFIPEIDPAYSVPGENAGGDLSAYYNTIKEMGGFFEVLIEYPVAPLSSNATEVSEDGKTMTWDIIETPTVHIEFERNDFAKIYPNIDIDSLNHFADVKAYDSIFFDAVVWAQNNGIAEGTSETTFSPDDICTREQVVTWLWRAMGEEEPSEEENPFTDVDESAYSYKAILWAVERGITNGTSETTFSPDVTCSYAHILTFLYRAFGDTQLEEGEEWYSAAVEWADENYLLDDMEDGEIDLMGPCRRGYAVTYLYWMTGIGYDSFYSDLYWNYDGEADLYEMIPEEPAGGYEEIPEADS